MSKSLPERPNLDHLREQAKDLLRSYRKGEPEAIERFRVVHSSSPALHDAQSVIAREYGFPSWSKLVEHVEAVRAQVGITDEVAKEYVEAAVLGRPERLRRFLDLYPGLPGYNAATRLVSGRTADVPANEPLDPLGWRPLEYVAYSRVHHVVPEAYAGLESEAKRQIESGADPNASHLFDEEASLPVLFGAMCEGRHVGISKLLLDAGAKPNDGESIYHAAQQDQPEMLQLLLDAGADLSMRDPHWGNTPLYFLAGYRRTDPAAGTALRGCAWLLEHGADPNVRSGEQEETPLIQACKSGFTPLVPLLLRFQADPNLRGKDGMSAHKWAVLLGNAEAAQALVAAGAEDELTAGEQFLAQCARGVIPDQVPPLDERERGVIVKLAEQGSVKGVEACLAAGLPVNYTTREGETPLHFACFCGWAGVVEVLVAAGARLDLTDNTYSATPLQWALHGAVWNRNAEGDYISVVRRLLAAGADRSQVQEFADYSEIEAERLRDVLAAIG